MACFLSFLFIYFSYLFIFIFYCTIFYCVLYFALLTVEMFWFLLLPICFNWLLYCTLWPLVCDKWNKLYLCLSGQSCGICSLLGNKQMERLLLITHTHTHKGIDLLCCSGPVCNATPCESEEMLIWFSHWLLLHCGGTPPGTKRHPSLS